MNEAELSALRLAHAKEIADVELRRAQDVNRWAERVVEREKEVEGLQAQLAARPLNRDLESLEHVTDLYGRSLGEWRELSAWIESRVAPLPGERLTLVEMVKHAAMVYAAPQELVYAAPLSPSAPAHDAYTKAAVEYAEACVRAYCGPTFNRVAESGTNYAAFKALYDARKRGESSAPPAETTLMLKRLDGQPPLYVHGTKEAVDYVQKMIAQPAPGLTTLEQAAVEAMDARTHFVNDKYPHKPALRLAWEEACARYNALRDGGKAMGSPSAVKVPFPSRGMDHRGDALVYPQFDPAKHAPQAPHVIDYSKPASFPLSIEIHGIDQHGKPVDMSDYTATASVRDGKSGLVEVAISPARPQEPADVWLAQYADGQIYFMPEGLHGVASHQTATRYLRVRLPVVEVVENEKGGA